MVCFGIFGLAVGQLFCSGLFDIVGVGDLIGFQVWFKWLTDCVCY